MNRGAALKGCPSVLWLLMEAPMAGKARTREGLHEWKKIKADKEDLV